MGLDMLVNFFITDLHLAHAVIKARENKIFYISLKTVLFNMVEEKPFVEIIQVHPFFEVFSAFIDPNYDWHWRVKVFVLKFLQKENDRKVPQKRLENIGKKGNEYR